MNKLDDNAKKRLINQLINTRRELTWMTQTRSENSEQFAKRVEITLSNYQNRGNLAKKEFFEITNSVQEREKLAIYTLIRGIKGEVKNYMCKPEQYKSFKQAHTHMIQINKTLQRLAQIKKSLLTLSS